MFCFETQRNKAYYGQAVNTITSQSQMVFGIPQVGVIDPAPVVAPTHASRRPTALQGTMPGHVRSRPLPV